MEHSKKKKTMIAVICLLLAFIALLWLTDRLLLPKYSMDNIPEGALIREYYEETTPHQILFVGDCEVYENFSPDVLWTEYGFTSYIRGSAQQLIWQSYYLLEEMLQEETPDAVVFNVLSMKYGEPQNEAYNRMSLDGMKWSASKWRAVRASMTEEETFLSYVFPLLRYHSRWNELTADDFTGLGKQERVSDSGYLMNVRVKAAENVPEGKKLADYAFSEICYSYLDKMADLCDEKGVLLILVKAPSLYPYWYPEWDQQIKEYAKARGIPYINLLDHTEEIGLDYSTDTYDAGLHLNVYGAEKVSRWFGAWLTEEGGMKPLSETDLEDAEKERISQVYEQKHLDYMNRKNEMEKNK